MVTIRSKKNSLTFIAFTALLFGCELAHPATLAPRSIPSTQPRRITPPAAWRTTYYALMRELGRDTLGGGFLGHRQPAPRFEELSFFAADSIPGHLAYGYSDATPLLGVAEPDRRVLIFHANEVERDSMAAWLLRHEMAHVIEHRADHPPSIFNRKLGTTWDSAELRVAGLLKSVRDAVSVTR